MALADSNDPNKDFINALTYLGKGPFNIGMPGGSDISVGAGPAPAPGINVGTFGQRFGGGPAQSGAVGAGGSGGGGSDILGMLQQYLKAGGKGADFAKRLSGGGDTQGLDVLKSMAGGGEIGLGADTALSGLGTELPNTQLLQTPEFAGILKDLQGTLGSSSLQDPTLGLDLTTGLGSEAGAGSSLAGSIGTAGAGAGALSALLGAIASSTGSPDLAKTAQYIGTAANAAGLAGTGANLAATGGTLAAGGAGAGLGAAAGAATIPIAAALLADEINQLAGGEPIYDFGAMMEPLMGSYPTFGKRLGATLGMENLDLNSLASALPYVQSQQQLQDILGLYKSDLGQRIGGYGEGSSPFEVPGLPGATGKSHEWGQVANFDPETQLLNQMIGGMKGNLPATGGDAAQLWNMFRTQNAPTGTGPLQVTMPDGSVQYMDPSAYAGWYNQMAGPMLQSGQQPPDFMSNAIPYGGEGYNYQGAGLLAPGNAPGAPTDAFMTMLAQLRGGGGAPAPSAVAPNQPGQAPNDVYQDLLKQYGMA